jgi:glycosyltransferase involved in cell wall biosynthesis
MRIGIDARTILNPEKGEAIGVGHYTYQLIRHLLDMDKENEYVLFFDFHVREKDVKKFTRPNTKIKFYPFSDYKKYMPGAYSELLGTATLTKEKLDILHSTSPQSRIPIGYRGKCVVTFHDLASYNQPQCYPKVKRAKFKTISSLMAKKADKIIAVSNSTKEDIKKIFGIPEDRIKVIYSGLDRRFFDEPKVDSQKVLDKYGISKKYILFLGTLEPIKNIVRLLEAFAKFKEDYKKLNKQLSSSKFGYQLVLAGKRGWLSEEYQRIAKDRGIGKDIITTGYIVGDELVPLFKRSEFFIMPSLYEGFGMTVLEAFATGTPAILSKVSSLPEIAGDAACFINPIDTDEIASAMMKFATDENLRQDYRQKGLEQARKFDWEKCARETLELYNSLMKN